MIKKVSVFLLCFFVFGKVFAQKPGFVKNTNIDIVYKDKNGNDMLDSNNAVHFSAKDITIYNLAKGEKVKVNKPKMDYPNNHFIYKDDSTGTNHLRVFLETKETLIQLSPTVTDTIKCIIKKTKNGLQLSKVWYNGKLVWHFSANASQVITITK